MPSYVSTVNLMKTAAAVTASSEQSGYEDNHLREPEYRGEPWRSTGTTEQTIVIDHGQAKSMGRIVLIGANFGLFSVQQHTADSWATPDYDSGPIAVTRDPDHRLYRRWFERAPLTPLTLRFTRIVIPGSQTPFDGAAHYEIAGIFMTSDLLALPRGCRPRYEVGIIDPREIVEAESGFSVAYQLDDQPIAVQRWIRQATKNPMNPGVDDELGEWRDIDRAIAAAGGQFCYFVDHWGTSAAWIMNQTNQSAWKDLDLVHAEDSWDLTEATAG